MQRRRFQSPKPERHGKNWTLRVWIDVFEKGRPVRKQVRWNLGEIAKMNQRQAAQGAAQKIAPLNLGLQPVNACVTFADYVNGTYEPCEMPLLAAPTQARYRGVLKNYLLPVLGDSTIGQITVQRIQLYFNGFADSPLRQESREKI